MGQTLALLINTFGSLAPVTAFAPITTPARTIVSSMIQTGGNVANRPIRIWSQQSDTINAPGTPGDYDIANFTFAPSGVKELATPLDRCGTTIPENHHYLATSFTPNPPFSPAIVDVTIRLE